MSDDETGLTIEVIETSAGVYIVTGRDEAGRSVSRHGEDLDALRADCLAWLRSVGSLREFVGFVWRDDFADQTGVLIEATDVGEAAAIVADAFGGGFKTSIWSEEDAARSRA